jgi:hypothetical protein
MPRPRPFPYTGSQTGVFHVVSRVAGREFALGDEEKEFFIRTLHAYARLLGVVPEYVTWELAKKDD